MLDRIVDGEQAWREGTIDDIRSYTVSLPEDGLSVLDEAVEGLKAGSCPIEEARVRDYDCSVLREAAGTVAAALQTGRGFAIVDGVPMERYSPREARLIFWLFGQLIGFPHKQSAKGGVLFDVRDEGHDITKGSRYAVTNAELTFHTDNARSEVVPEYVGLLCVHAAKTGGVSQLVSVYTVHNELLKNHADVLEVLYQPFYFDRRGLRTEGESPVSRFPVFEWDGRELLCRFIRYYIEVGHEKVGEPLAPDQVRALDVLQSLLQRRDLRVAFTMQRGQMLFSNNRWVLHNRTAFEDYPEPERRRHFVRLWLSRRGKAGH